MRERPTVPQVPENAPLSLEGYYSLSVFLSGGVDLSPSTSISLGSGTSG